MIKTEWFNKKRCALYYALTEELTLLSSIRVAVSIWKNLHNIVKWIIYKKFSR